MPTSPLFEPVSLRSGITSRNRIWLAPLTNLQSHPDGTLSDDELRFLAMRADGGFGVVETCAAHVAQDGKAWAGELGLHDDAMTPGLGRLAARIHEGGALAMVQLFHGGLRATPAVSGLPTMSASAVAEPGVETPRAATAEDIERVIGQFAEAARRVAEAGFDGIELHGAHGYLLSQFQSTLYNVRTDAWGGPLENRARLLRTVLRAVRQAAPALAIGVRLSPEEYGSAKGIDLDDTLQIARWLADDGVDFLHLSLWKSELPTRKRPEHHPTPLFREAVGPDVRLVVAGAIWTRAEAEAQLALGADAVALGRAAIANPDWPLLIADGRAPDVLPIAPEVLRDRGLSETFVAYMRRWKGFVTQG